MSLEGHETLSSLVARDAQGTVGFKIMSGRPFGVL